jgi:hypothetical protein
MWVSLQKNSWNLMFTNINQMNVYSCWGVDISRVKGAINHRWRTWIGLLLWKRIGMMIHAPIASQIQT